MRCSTKKVAVATTTLALLAGGTSAALADRGPSQVVSVVNELPAVCEARLAQLTAIAPDEVAALVQAAAIGSIDDLLAAAGVLSVAAQLNIDPMLEEVGDGTCDVVELAFHLKHRALIAAGWAAETALEKALEVKARALHLAAFAAGEALDLASFVKGRALGTVGFAGGAAAEIISDVVELATTPVQAGLEVTIDLAVRGLFGANADASTNALAGLL